jgi:hypothetical protein
MMNLIQQQDDLRSMPMQRLMQEAQNPSGMYPQYLVVATIKEKTDMQKRAQAQQQSQQQPQGTVSEQVIQEGIMSVPPQQPIPTPTGRGILDNPNIPMNMTREEYEAMKAQALLPPGNGYASGGVVRMQEGGVFETDFYDREGRFRKRPRTPEEQAYLESFSPIEVLKSAADYYGGGIRNIWQKGVNVFSDKMSELASSGDPNITADQELEAVRESFFPAFSRSNMYNPTFQPEDEQPIEKAQDFSQDLPSDSTPVTAEPQGGSGAAVQATDDARNIPVTGAGNDYLSKLMEYVGKKRETLDLSDLREQQRESSFANALVELSAGIAEGDLAKGIRAAGAAQARGAEKARELDQAERLMGYQEEKRAMESDIAILSTLSQLESQLKRASMAAKAQGISGIDFADMMKTASERAEKAVERIANIQKGTPEYVTAFNRALAQIYRQMVSVLPVGVIGTDYSGYSIVPEQ